MSSDVIDVDAHIRESNNDIRAYLVEPYCKRGSPLLASDGMWAGEGTNSDHSENPDIATRLSDMDREGISIAVLFPTNSLGMRRIIEPDYATAYAQAYNNYIADICKQSSRIKGIALLPFIDVDEAVKELNRAITELGLSGIGIATQSMKEHLGSKIFWPIYEEMQRLNVPLCVHGGRDGPAGEIRFDSFIFMHTIGRPVETAIQFAGLLYAGIAERFPRLRVGFFECGAGWVPYWIERMDEEWEKRGKREAPFCKRKPSEYILHGNWYFSAEPEEKSLPHVIETIGDDKILFASDYPHWDGLFPNAVSTFRNRSDLPAATKEKILTENGRRFYGWS